MKTPFGFGPSKLGVTPGGGALPTAVAARNEARLAYVADVVVEVALVDVVGMADDILGMADDISGTADNEIR